MREPRLRVVTFGFFLVANFLVLWISVSDLSYRVCTHPLPDCFR